MKTPQSADCPCIDAILEDLYAMFAAAGMFSAQIDEPDLDLIEKRAAEFGRRMATKARRRKALRK